MRDFCFALGFALVFSASPALAQTPTYSIDFQGPTLGVIDAFSGAPITDGDILTTAMPGPPGPNPAAPGPLPAPGIEVGALPGAPGAVPGGLGILPGAFGFLELDALSYGRDAGGGLFFSVDEFATGVPGPLPPDVSTEGALAAAEAAADVFTYLGLVVPTPPGPIFGNTAVLDGDGLAPSGALGLGLLEPNPPSPGAVPDFGDNLDALDMDTTFGDLVGPVFFSLDSFFVDPLELPPVNSGTAVGNGFSGADVLLSFAGVAPVIAIPAVMLGLDLAGFDTDDLDALVFDDADGSLNLTPGVDTILFSVRRGSAIIGAPDSAFGMPIEEGDILTLPAAQGAPPALYISAEALGLGTARSGTAGPFGPDDLDALDVVVADTDGDGIPDPSDNCLVVANGPLAGVCYVAGVQVDTDGDGFGNPCDGDFNNDTAVNSSDVIVAGPDLASGIPTPGTGTDMNCDGAVNSSDVVLFYPQLTQGFPGP